jgi:glycosyltransferase involved in cell wall biosynthesis
MRLPLFHMVPWNRGNAREGNKRNLQGRWQNEKSMARPFISIIISASSRSNRASFVVRSMGSLRYPHDRVEVILVNHGNGGMADDFSAALPFPVLVLKVGERAQGRNAGIRKARGDFILFLDDDLIPEANLLHEHMSTHAEHPAGIVLGQVLALPGTGILERMRFDELFWRQFNSEHREYAGRALNMTLRRKDILAANLSGDEADSFGFQDTELLFRMVKDQGLTICRSEKARAWRIGELSLVDALDSYFLAGRSFATFIGKYPHLIADSRSWRLSRHIYDTLDRVLKLKALPLLKAQECITLMRCLEKRFRDDAAEDHEEALRGSYQVMLDYSFDEGAFLGVRGLARGKTPLFKSIVAGHGRPHRELRFFWLASSDQFSGYGRASTLYIDALAGLGYQVHREDASHPSQVPEEFSLQDVDFFVNHHWKPPSIVPKEPYKLQIYACETTVIPEWLIEPFNMMDEIWVPSSFCRQALIDSGVKAHLSIIPYGIDRRRFKPRRLERKQLLDDYFCFMSAGSLFEYKGFDVLIRAYYEEFSRSEQALLALKVRVYPEASGYATREKMRRFIDSIKDKLKKEKYPLLYVFYDRIEEEEFPDFLNSCDAYVAPSRGEGFCLPILEAMSLGKTIIATGFGGQMDYLTGENAYLINYSMTQVLSREHTEHKQGMWAEPSVEHLRHLMRRVFEHRNEAEKKASLAQSHSRRNWNTKILRNALARRIDEICDRHGLGIEGWLKKDPQFH